MVYTNGWWWLVEGACMATGMAHYHDCDFFGFTYEHEPNMGHQGSGRLIFLKETKQINQFATCLMCPSKSGKTISDGTRTTRKNVQNINVSAWWLLENCQESFCQLAISSWSETQSSTAQQPVIQPSIQSVISPDEQWETILFIHH